MVRPSSDEHSESTYVYQAIQHPRVNYLLKIEGIDKVIQVVEDTALETRKEIKTGDLIREKASLL